MGNIKETSNDEENATKLEKIEMSLTGNLATTDMAHVPYSFAPTTGMPAPSDTMNYGHFIGNVCPEQKTQANNCSNDFVRHQVLLKIIKIKII